MQKQTNVIDKNSPEYLQKQIAGARYSLLLILIFTVINLVMLLIGVDEYLYGEGVRYFLFSASVPYNLTMFGISFDLGIDTFTITALVISAVILGVYLLCWLLSKKKIGWLTVALVMFVLDTLALLGLSLWMETLTNDILDIVFHGWVIVELVQALAANKKLKAMPAEVPAGYQNYPYTQNAPTNAEPWDQKNSNNGPEF